MNIDTVINLKKEYETQCKEFGYKPVTVTMPKRKNWDDDGYEHKLHKTKRRIMSYIYEDMEAFMEGVR